MGFFSQIKLLRSMVEFGINKAAHTLEKGGYREENKL